DLRGERLRIHLTMPFEAFANALSNIANQYAQDRVYQRMVADRRAYEQGRVADQRAYEQSVYDQRRADARADVTESREYQREVEREARDYAEKVRQVMRDERFADLDKELTARLDA